MQDSSAIEEHVGGYPLDNLVHARACVTVSQQDGLPVSHGAALPHHALDVHPDIGRKVDLVDDQQVRLENAQSTLARDVVSTGGIDDEQPVVDQVQRKGGGEVVATAFDQHQIERPELALQLIGCLDVQRWVLANRRVGAGPRLHRHYTGGIDQTAALHALGVFFGHQVIGDDGNVSAALDEARDQLLEQSGLPGSHWATDAYAGRAA